MLCMNGELVISADEICDSCKVKLCPTAEQLIKIHEQEYSETREWRTISIEINSCPMYQEILP